jgi:hypothetical protein
MNEREEEIQRYNEEAFSGNMHGGPSQDILMECFRWKDYGHLMLECKKPCMCERCDEAEHDSLHCKKKNYSDLIASLCATQVEG